jgi:DNA processing protein
VLGTPINQIHPRSNESLAKRILERGAIVSELASGSAVHAWNFSYRNRIVAALADATLIIEASLNSGTMSTANYTNEQNKPIYAVPGDISRPMSEGCNKLIKDGAMVYTELSDLHLGFGVTWRSSIISQYDDCSVEERLIIFNIKLGINRDEDIIAKAKLSPAEFAQATMTLQLKNIIKSIGNGEWALV